MQGTNINLADGGDDRNRELALIREKDILKDNLVALNMERANKATIINVISDFPSMGVEEKGILKSYKFKVTIALIILVLGILALLEVNKYLKGYRKQ